MPAIDLHGYDFIPKEFLPPGKDEYWLRDSLYPAPKAWRALRAEEIAELERRANYCRDWSRVLVRDPFDPGLVRGCSFYGLVRLGALRDRLLRHHDFQAPAGIRNSAIVSCDIGDDVSIQDCALISHYVIGDLCILSRVDEMQATNHAKFGNGALKDGEDEEVRVTIDVMNEAGGRAILPFDEMLPADAFLWAAYRDDEKLVAALARITQERYGGKRGAYGTVGSRAVIKSCAIIKDAAIGERAYIKGANKLKNITILSSEEEPTQIGEGVELVNGIVGFGCRVFYGAKAVRFVMGRNCGLKYGARLIHSVLGDNSTVSCCEILNNLIFPMHEQHHNNSFLIASLVQGMSNMAAAATIGSNHNSRANDGEIRAGRGFWPGLAVSLKHSSRFASYALIAKGEYPAELNIAMPFSLISNNVHKNRLELMPAYFWIHNLYALQRNSWKVLRRDKRAIKAQHVETDYLAPDTVEEIISAIAALEGWLAKAGVSNDDERVRAIPCRGLERGKRSQAILRPLEGLAAYKQMLRWYAAKTIVAFLDSRPDLDYARLAALFPAGEERIKEWVNMGGQIAPAFRVDKLRREIGEGKIASWDAIHGAYREWREAYAQDKARHALAVFSLLNAQAELQGAPLLRAELAASIETSAEICRRIYETRAKDFRNSFKKITFRNEREMEMVLGKPGDDPFVRHSFEEAGLYEEMSRRAISRL